jgi:hypothetical protein
MKLCLRPSEAVSIASRTVFYIYLAELLLWLVEVLLYISGGAVPAVGVLFYIYPAELFFFCS